MYAPHEVSSNPILDELHESLRHVLTVLEQKWENETLVLRALPSGGQTQAERAFRLEGPEKMTVQIRFGVYPLGDGTHEVYVEIEDGPTRRFTYDPTKADQEAEKARLGRTVTATLLDEIEPRLGQLSDSAISPDAVHSVPQLALGENGCIDDLNGAARRMLRGTDDQSFDPNFLTYVHGRNLRRVMRDLARMVQQNLKRARWLLRLQTADDRWRWFRVAVFNQLQTEEQIRLKLYPVGKHPESA